MSIKDLYSGTVLTLRGRCGATLLNAQCNMQELSNLITYQSLSTAYLVHAVDVVSANAVDTAAGTGAQQVEIAGLDGNYNLQYEIVSLNGQTAVTSSKKWLRVFSGEVVRAGTGGTNAGNIVVYKSGQGGMVAGGIPPTLTSAWLRILAGFGAGTSGLFTVPRGMTVEAKQLIFSARTQISDFHLVSQAKGVQEVLTFTVTAAPTGNGNIALTLDGVAGPNIAVVTTDSIAGVAAKVNATLFPGWSSSVSGAVVTFTSNVGVARVGANTLSAAATGVTGTFVEVTAGTTIPFITEYSFGITNNTAVINFSRNNGMEWGEKTDIYLRASSTTAGGVVTANLMLAPQISF